MRRIFLQAIILILIAHTSIISQSTYYVSVNGNDNNNGLNITSAFATLQHAADVATAGDSVLVLSGNYTGFDIRTSGTSALPIVFKAVSNDVIINQHNSITNDGINIEDADWIEIHNFNLINQPRAGIRIVLSDFVKIKHNTCSNNFKWGIFTGFTNDILIEANSCSYSQDEHGIYVSNSSDRPTIINNHSFNNNGCGIHMNGDLSMGDDGIISNAIVAGNIIHDNGVGGGSAINMDGVQDSEIYNNVLYNNHASGIAMYQIDGAEGSKNNKVFNNTIVHPADGRWAILIVNGSTGNTIYNNILINNHSFRGSICLDDLSTSGFVSDYNLLVNRLSIDDGNSNITLSSWQALGYDTHSQIVLPESQLFINHSSGDFHLLPSSQPINIGTALVNSVIAFDIDGVSRPQGSGYDIGAYEFLSTTFVDDQTLPNNFILDQNYPNPFNPTTKIRYSIPDVTLSGGTATIEGSRVQLKIYDILGNEIATLVNEYRNAGSYEIEFNSSSINHYTSSGVYFYRLQFGNYVDMKKMLMIK